ncbi:MAG: substrate-binding domain-containing protein, partial [Pseudonocardiales bacterium]
IDEIRRRGTAVVLVDRASTRRQCSVSVDDHVGGELAIGHLLEQGHTHIGFVGGPLSIKQVSERLAGARRAVDRAGLPEATITLMETPGLNVAAGRRTGELIAAMPAARRPSAVFCANDLLALGVLQEMTRRRLDVPGDLAIVGYDDIDFAAAAAVPLTSVLQPRSQLGQAAMDLLIDEVEDPKTHRHRQVVFEPELVIRESTKAGA